MKIRYKSIIGLDAIKELKTEQELNFDCTREKIEQNIRKLQSKFNLTMTDADIQ